MSLLLNCQSISKTYSAKELFKDISLSINERDKIGIIGPNGSGKSTLLKILAEKIEPDTGKITTRKGLKAFYIDQSMEFHSDDTIISVLRQAAHDAKRLEFEIEGLINSIIGKVGFTDPEQKISNLSGGWKKRVEIAIGLIFEPDLLMLDEPTNHLDIEGALWLESLLSAAPFSWITISHDRSFLQNTVNKIFEINKTYANGIISSSGNYQDFLSARLNILSAQAKYEESLANKARREIEWLRQGVKARTTKSKLRIEAAENIKDELAAAKQRNGIQSNKIEFSASDRKSKKLLSAEHITKKLGDKLLIENFSTTITSRKIVGILGKNGSGKTTLMKILAGILSPDSGTCIQLTGLKVVYFDQNRDLLDPEWALKRALAENGEQVIYNGNAIHVITWAKRFLFTKEHLDKKIKDLSGGEQAKAIIARLMLEPADLLCLDEPTNDLDIATMETLEDSLNDFAGAVLLISHDRYMIQKLCDSFIGLDGHGGAKQFADYEQWENESIKITATKKTQDKNKQANPKEKPQEKKAKKLSYKDQRDYDQIESLIAEAEQRVEDWQETINDPQIATDSAKLEEAYAGLNKAQKKLDTLYARWEELEEIISQM
ncbi:MAG: ABC-F family ATP-binding cassette domain-containing protein [Bdellovibrionota bacterium]